MKYYPVCIQCVKGRGDACNTPSCAYCRSPAPLAMPWPEYGIDVQDIVAKANVIKSENERLRKERDQFKVRVEELEAEITKEVLMRPQVKREAIFKAVCNERDFQDHKYGTVEERPHTVAEWLLIMEAEFLEAKVAWLESTKTNRKKKPDTTEALKEILQVVSVGFACIEQHRLKERES